MTALRAKRPAPSITLGFAVLVQLVMAAMTTSPDLIAVEPVSGVFVKVFLKESGTFESGVRCSGRLGPASDGSTFERSNSRTES